MAIKTQGTQVYFIEPVDDSVVEVTGVTNFNPGGAPFDEIETTSLTDTDKTYLPGLRSPTEATIELNFDPTNASHVRIFELFTAGTVVDWAAGWSDDTTAPTADSDGFVLPSTRTWYTLSGFVKDCPFDFAVNTKVVSTVTIRKSGVSNFVASST
ncbi:MAG TPA: phage tail tube protein [Patescibacteria group bacterium]|nr:phage tail tube protein [Patescibacteria group bacterium]